MSENIVIGIEGLVGAGKTSICKNLLNKIPNSIVLHGGNIYRAIVYAMLSNGIRIEELKNLTTNMDVTKIIDKYNIEVKVENRETCIYINGKMIKDEDLQSDETSMAVSIVSNIADNKKVFEYVGKIVDKLKEQYNVIFSGRSIMIIYPNTNYHFLITADLDERVNRKYNQYDGKIDKEELKKHIIKRDELQEDSGFYKKYDKTIIIDVTDCKDVEQSTLKVIEKLGKI